MSFRKVPNYHKSFGTAGPKIRKKNSATLLGKSGVLLKLFDFSRFVEAPFMDNRNNISGNFGKITFFKVQNKVTQFFGLFFYF